MRENLRKYVLSLFANMADTPRNHALRDEVLQNTMDRYDDAIANGFDEGQAYAEAIAGMGDIESLLEPDPAAQANKKKRLIVLLAVAVCVVVVGVIGVFARIASRVTYNIMAPSAMTVPVAVDTAVMTPEPKAEVFSVFSTSIDFDSTGYVCSTGNILAEGVTKVEIHWLDGFVNVYEGDSQHFTLHEDETQYPLCWKIDGDTLIVQPAMPGDHHDFPSKSLYMNLPAGLALEVFSLEVTSGDAFLDNITASTVNTSSVSANVNLYECRVDALHMDNVSGDLSFDGEVTGALNITTVSGNAYVYAKDTPDDVYMESVSGNVTLTCEDARAMEIEFDSASGDLYCDRELVWNAQGKAVIEGDGSPAQIVIETVSGNADIWSY